MFKAGPFYDKSFLVKFLFIGVKERDLSSNRIVCLKTCACQSNTKTRLKIQMWYCVCVRGEGGGGGARGGGGGGGGGNGGVGDVVLDIILVAEHLTYLSVNHI